MKIKRAIKKVIPFINEYRRVCGLVFPISYVTFLLHKLHITERDVYWYKPNTCWVGMPKRIYVGKNSSVGRTNNFFQAYGGIYIGDFVQFATRVSLLTSNHDIYNQYKSHHAPIKIGDYCWLGMNTSVLAGVELGPRTIVATGAVVNKSFPEGFCILGGVPAKIVKKLDSTLFNKKDYEREFYNYGYLPAEEVESDPQKFINKYLDSNFFEVVDDKIQLKQK